MSRPSAVLAGLGTYLPERIVTNDEIAARTDTTDEWIRQRTGISQRRFAAAGQPTSDLAVRAGAQALRSAGIERADAVVVATSTPDRLCPATAPEVASRLGLGGAAAFDVGAVCSGFVYALATGAGLVAAGIAGQVLVIGADTFSTIVHPADRTTAAIFGDGAGAVVLRAGDPDEPGAIGPFELGSDGALSDLANVPCGGSRCRYPEIDRLRSIEDGAYLLMDGRDMYRNAVARMSESSLTVLDRAGWSIGEVDRLVAHQANARILAAVASRIGLPPDRCVVNIDRVGNTVAGSIPLALAHAVAVGDLRGDERVLLTAFGGGLTWGATVLTWPKLTACQGFDT